MSKKMFKTSKENKKRGSSQVLTKQNQNYGEMKIKIKNKTSGTKRLKDKKSKKTEQIVLNDFREELQQKRVEIDEHLEICQIQTENEKFENDSQSQSEDDQNNSQLNRTAKHICECQGHDQCVVACESCKNTDQECTEESCCLACFRAQQINGGLDRFLDSSSESLNDRDLSIHSNLTFVSEHEQLEVVPVRRTRCECNARECRGNLCSCYREGLECTVDCHCAYCQNIHPPQANPLNIEFLIDIDSSEPQGFERIAQMGDMPFGGFNYPGTWHLSGYRQGVPL